MRNLVYLLGLLCLTACSGVCRVEGKMSDFQGDEAVFVLRKTGEFTFDTIMQTTMKDGTFLLELPQDLWGEQYELKFGNQRSTVSFFAENGNVRIEGSKAALYNSTVNGTPENDKWERYHRFMLEQGTRRNQAMREISSGTESDSVKRQKLGCLFSKYDEELKHYKDSLGKSDPTSVVALYVNYQILPLLKYNQIDSILQYFSGHLSENRYYREMLDRADILRKIAPGVEVPDFTVKTVDGGEISLSSFRGNYVILDFWASWCAPCREETVYIRKLYDKYHAKGLQVFSVSLDDKKEAWTKAIQEDQMNWNHGCQLLKGGKNTPVAQLYGIDGIPAIWVIDPAGKILAQGLQGDKLVDFCSALFEK